MGRIESLACALRCVGCVARHDTAVRARVAWALFGTLHSACTHALAGENCFGARAMRARARESVGMGGVGIGVGRVARGLVLVAIFT